VPDCGITITNPTTQYNIVYGGRTDQGYLQFAAIAPDSGQVVNAVNSPAQPGTYKLFDSTLQIISVDGFKVKYQISNN